MGITEDFKNLNEGTVNPAYKNFMCCRRRLARKKERQKRGGGGGRSSLCVSQSPRNGENETKKNWNKKKVIKKVECGIGKVPQKCEAACEHQRMMVVDLVTAALRLAISLDGSGDIDVLLSQIINMMQLPDKASVVKDVDPSPALGGDEYSRVVDDEVDEEVGDEVIVDEGVDDGVVVDEVIVDDEVGEVNIPFESPSTEEVVESDEAVLDMSLGDLQTPGVDEHGNEVPNYYDQFTYATNDPRLDLLDPRGSARQDYVILRTKGFGSEEAGASAKVWEAYDAQVTSWYLPDQWVQAITNTVDGWWQTGVMSLGFQKVYGSPNTLLTSVEALLFATHAEATADAILERILDATSVRFPPRDGIRLRQLLDQNPIISSRLRWRDSLSSFYCSK